MCRQALRDLRLKGFWSGYFAARAAPLGRVGAQMTAGAFYNFAPVMVAAAVPGCWSVTSPATLVVVRAEAAARALVAHASPSALARCAGELASLRLVVGAARCEGRILAAANQPLWSQISSEMPERVDQSGDVAAIRAAAELWQASTVLREHRGDGHVAALLAAGLDGCAAHVLAAATSGVPVEVLRDNRGWNPRQWGAALDALQRRGLIGADGGATAPGRALRSDIEELTDALAEPAYSVLTDEACRSLYGAL